MEECSCFGETSFDVTRKKDFKIRVQSLSHCYAHASLENFLRNTFTRTWPILRVSPGSPLQTFFFGTKGAEPRGQPC